MKVLLFGCGNYYRKCRHLFTETDVIGILDNDASRWGNEIDGSRIMSPEEGVKLPYDRVFILSTYIEEISNKLNTLGVPSNKVYDIYRLRDGLYGYFPSITTKTYGETPRDSAKVKVCIIAFHLELSGGPIANYCLGQVLKQNGYEVCVLAAEDGEMRREYNKIGIQVCIDSLLYCKNIDDVVIEHAADCIWADGALVFHMLLKTENNVRIFLWLHAGEIMYRYRSLEIIKEMNLKNTNILAVGKYPAESFLKRCKGVDVGILRYGVIDESEGDYSENKKSSLTFAVIGEICSNKAQNVFLNAYRKLPRSLRNDIRCIIAGRFGNEIDYNRNIINEVDKCNLEIDNSVELLGEIKREKMKELYRRIDVLVCPSLEDAMPIVCVEAVMHSKMVLCSEKVGFAEFIRSYENGLIFKVNNSEDLSEKMRWLYDHSLTIKQMGENARTIFENEFSMEIFNKNVNIVMENAYEKGRS